MKKCQFEAAIRLARQVYDSNIYHVEYEVWVKGGNDPREHFLWDAAEVLGFLKQDEFAGALRIWTAGNIKLPPFEL